MNTKLINNWSLKIIELYSCKLTSSFYGREIAKKLNANQRTILLNLNKLEKNHLLKSKIKGKNREFTLNKENDLVKEIILMAEVNKTMIFLDEHFEIYSIVKKLKQIIKNTIIIYGSYAKQNYTKESDLDILILGKYPKKSVKALLKSYSLKVQVMNLSKQEFIKGIKKNEAYMKEVLENHIIIKDFEEFITWRFKYEQNQMV